MIKLHQLSNTIARKHKRLGRGHGSGRMKTSGRGQKGQKARGKIKAFFEGGQLPLVKRLPFLRGKLRNPSFHANNIIINVKNLSKYPGNSIIDRDFLVKEKLILLKDKNSKIKILGDGKIEIPLIIKLPLSNSARKKIEAAGGRIELEEKK
jgi:large subunit ribosomal protein L15